MTRDKDIAPLAPPDKDLKATLDHIDLVRHGMASIDWSNIGKAKDAIIQTAIRQYSTVWTAGNGSSAALSQHWACDHMKGLSVLHSDTQDQLLINVVSLASNMALLTAIANDCGYENVFVHQLERQFKPGDVFVGISASGNSPNVVKAAEFVRNNGGTVIGLTGFKGGKLKQLAQIDFHIPINEYEAVEDVHHIIMHILAKRLRETVTLITKVP